MKRAHLRFGKGFHPALSNSRAQIATMTLAAGKSEGDAHNRHRGADQWLFVVRGAGVARVNGKRYSLRPGSLLLIERGDEHEIIASRGRLETPTSTCRPATPPRATSFPPRSGDERAALGWPEAA